MNGTGGVPTEVRLRACEGVLRRLEKAKRITLPPARRSSRTTSCASDSPKPQEKVDSQEPAERLDDIVLRELTVRPIKHVEVAEWREMMARHHCLGNGRIVGETIACMRDMTRCMRLVVLSAT